MADWFVYQRDVYPNSMDPDILGTMLVPDYDAHGNVVYCDPNTPTMNGVRRIRTRWALNPHIVQYDLVVHMSQPTNNVTTHSNNIYVTPPRHSISSQSNIHTVQWWPKKEAFRFINLSNGFRFENLTQSLCIYVTRDNQGQHHVQLFRLGSNGECQAVVGIVIGIRIYELALFVPGSEGWFSRYNSITTRSLAHEHESEANNTITRPMLV